MSAQIEPRQSINPPVHRSKGEPGRAPVAMTPLVLRAEDEREVLEFLGRRPMYTFGLTGFIRTNGIESPFNRGVYYGCRDEQGDLIGVALIGHFIVFETEFRECIEAFARQALAHSDPFLLLGEQEKVKQFWSYYSVSGQPALLQGTERLMELNKAPNTATATPELRLARADDLDQIVPAHAETAVAESGVNPLDTDPEGFRLRCARRIEQGLTWVWTENGELMFKAEVISESDEVVYLEGIWVNETRRRMGYGTRAMSHLCQQLLSRTKTICILVNQEFDTAQQFYKSLGFEFVCYYDTVFLKRQS